MTKKLQELIEELEDKWYGEWYFQDPNCNMGCTVIDIEEVKKFCRKIAQLAEEEVIKRLRAKVEAETEYPPNYQNAIDDAWSRGYNEGLRKLKLPLSNQKEDE